jgi:hypothetical protein
MMAGRRGTATILIVIAAVQRCTTGARCAERSSNNTYTSSAGSTLASISRRNATKSCAAVATRQHLACRDVQRREQAERAVAHVVMRRSFRLSDVNRQDRLRPLERLDLRFLVAPCSETC